MTEIVVYVAGTPRPQPRPRFVGGRVVSTGSKQAKVYRSAVGTACLVEKLKRTPASGAVDMELDFWFATKDTRRHGQPHTSRPDADNLAKLWMDCAERAGLLPKGDAKVARLTVRKTWSAEAGAQMTLRACENLPDPDG
jgi:Holliday junction resolvase RusA-like endonuclease